ncbi:MAG TPA: recombinase family protein, partial [Flavobacteriales bacterium]|nr:recombinase family protein [Flavobacteriales bacterium]
PTPQGKFMLQVAFGQSKYYSDNLSENVKRGIKHKVRRGEYPTLAPKGYINNPKTRNLDVDVTEAKIIGKAFNEFAEGHHSLATMSQRMALWGMQSKNGKPLCKASVLRILTNPIYLGLIHMHGEIHEGKFDPIVDKTTFEKVQEEIKRKAKPRLRAKSYNFPFTGLLTCSECGGMITAQYAKQGKFLYYRCSKRMGVKCTQPYIQDVVLLNLLREEISKVVLPTGLADLALECLEQRQREDIETGKTFYQNLENQLKETTAKLDKLINGFLDGFIDQEDYLSRKEELLKTKVDLQDQIKNFGKRGVVWFELAREFLKALRDAEKLAFSEDLSEIKSFLKKFGSNRLLDHKKVVLNFVEPIGIASKHRALAGAVGVGINKNGPH